MKKNVVVIGGGNGTSIVLRALKDYSDQLQLSAVISVADSGSSSGVLREQFQMVPPSDLMRAVIALSPYDHTTLRGVFVKNRPSEGPFKGHSLGNLFFAWGFEKSGDILDTIRALEEMVRSCGHVYPVCSAALDLCAKLSDGTIVQGEGAIDDPAYDRSLRITEAWLEPKGEITSEAQLAIEEADVIILGPGSVYTSLLSTLLVGGVREAIERSSGKIIYVPSTYLPSNGETGPTTLSGQIEVIESALPRAINTIVVSSERLENNPRAHDLPLEDYVKDVEKLSTHQCIVEDLSDDVERMNLKKLGALLIRIITPVS